MEKVWQQKRNVVNSYQLRHLFPNFPFPSTFIIPSCTYCQRILSLLVWIIEKRSNVSSYRRLYWTIENINIVITIIQKLIILSKRKMYQNKRKITFCILCIIQLL